MVAQTTHVSDAAQSSHDDVDVVEETLEQLGPFGLYQRYVMLLLILPNMLSAMYTFNYVFTADEVPFRCVVEECEGISSNFLNETASQLLPADRCRRHPPLGETFTCDPGSYNMTQTEPCELFVYENMDTIFAEFGLACRGWLRTLVGSVRNAALPLALLLTGFISDRWGRLTALCIFSAFAGLLGMVKSVSVSYYMYVAMEFLEAALGYGFNSAAYVMMIELARPSLRGTFACITGVFYGVGGMLLALAASKVPQWRTLLRLIHAPALLLPLYWMLLDESVRWLHASGRRELAASTVRKAAVWNKVSLDEDLMKKFLNETKKEETHTPNIWLSLVKSRVLVIRFLLCCWCWIAAAFVYYGLTINSVSLHGDKYVNFALNMAMEVVASLLLMMSLERIGRKWTIFTSFMLCGVSCAIPFFVSHKGTSLSVYFVGKLSITCAFNSVYVWTCELFPTRARSSALAGCSLVGRIGSIVAPQTPLLSASVQVLLYGSSSLLAALCALALPETRRTRLPQSASDAERMRTTRPPDPVPQPPAEPGPVIYSADM